MCPPFESNAGLDTSGEGQASPFKGPGTGTMNRVMNELEI